MRTMPRRRCSSSPLRSGISISIVPSMMPSISSTDCFFRLLNHTDISVEIASPIPIIAMLITCDCCADACSSVFSANTLTRSPKIDSVRVSV